LPKDRQVDPDGQGNRQIQSIHIPHYGQQVHLNRSLPSRLETIHRD
jgi:hypothetical protein